MLSVPAARSHDAAVVRCSQCGGARKRDELTCSFCAGGFTLHERDLHTICPACLARISDKARFCHHCATEIKEPQALGSLTEKRCPVCGDGHALTHRALAQESAVLECRRCAGIWVDRATFAKLTRKAMSEAAPGSSQPFAPAISKQQGPMYRRCVECTKMMARQNYGQKSGVIIDTCREHGLWLDLGELERVLAWLRAGHRPERRPREPAREAAAAPPASSSSTLDAFDAAGFGGILVDLIGDLFDGS